MRLAPVATVRWLLHYDNSDPMVRTTLYELKGQLLRRHAEFRGHDMQEIVKECWGSGWMHHDDGCPGDSCRRCGGTGVYERKWIRLQRWQWGRYVFHVPDGVTYKKPDSVQIHGLVKHADYGRASREAELWLYLLCGRWSSFWKALTSCCYCRPGLWPLCRAQKVAFDCRMLFVRFERKACWVCDRRFFRFLGDGLLCRKCSKGLKHTDEHFDDPPF